MTPRACTRLERDTKTVDEVPCDKERKRGCRSLEYVSDDLGRRTYSMSDTTRTHVRLQK